MDFSALQDELARIAHLAWCRRMSDRGWQSGRLTDAETKTHAAICPYTELTESQRERIRREIDIDELGDRMADAVECALNHRELSGNDIFVGMPVRLEGDPQRLVGHIVGWNPTDAPSGAVELILVKWPDGEVIGYCPAEGAIQPVEE